MKEVEIHLFTDQEEELSSALVETGMTLKVATVQIFPLVTHPRSPSGKGK